MVIKKKPNQILSKDQVNDSYEQTALSGHKFVSF